MFDHPDYRSGYSNWDISELYRNYYSSIGQLVSSGLFDIVGHLDVIKVFGYRPQGELCLSLNRFYSLSATPIL